MYYKIAIDGTSGSGKSTIGKMLAKKYDYIFVSTGGFYRSYAFILQSHNLIDSNIDDQINELKRHEIIIDGDNFFIDGINVNSDLKDEKIYMLASFIAQKDYIREFAKLSQINIANKHEKIVMDGRDIGTTIMPKADIKFYFYSSILTRTKRRMKELKSMGKKISFIVLFWDIFKRDWNDKHRKIAPLKKAKDAIKVNTSSKTVEQVLNEVLKYMGE